MSESATVEQTRREIAQLRELLEQKIKALNDVVSARFDAMDKALELAREQTGLADLAQRFEEMVERLTRLERDKGRSGGID